MSRGERLRPNLETDFPIRTRFRSGTPSAPHAFLERCSRIKGIWMKAVLSLIGIVFIIAWLVLWLAVKITFGAIHLLVVIGVILLVLALVKVV